MIQRLSLLNPSSLSLEWNFRRYLYRKLVLQPLYLHLSLLTFLHLVYGKRKILFLLIVFQLSDFAGRLRWSWSLRMLFSLMSNVNKNSSLVCLGLSSLINKCFLNINSSLPHMLRTKLCDWIHFTLKIMPMFLNRIYYSLSMLVSLYSVLVLQNQNITTLNPVTISFQYKENCYWFAVRMSCAC